MTPREQYLADLHGPAIPAKEVRQRTSGMAVLLFSLWIIVALAAPPLIPLVLVIPFVVGRYRSRLARRTRISKFEEIAYVAEASWRRSGW